MTLLAYAAIVAGAVIGVGFALLVAAVLWQAYRKLPEPDALKIVDRFGVPFGQMSREQMNRIMYRRN